MPWSMIGSMVGGLVNAGVNASNAAAERKAKRQHNAEIKKLAEQSNQNYDELAQEIANYYANRGSLGTDDDVNTYKQMVSEYNPEDYVYDFDEYNYDKTVDDFMNPYYDQIIQQTADTAQHTAAGYGMGRSTGAVQAIAQDVAEKSDELYNTALNAYNTDREQDYQEYSDYITNMQNKLSKLAEAKNNQITMYNNLASDYYDTQDAAMQDKVAVNQDKLSAQTQYASALL